MVWKEGNTKGTSKSEVPVINISANSRVQKKPGSLMLLYTLSVIASWRKHEEQQESCYSQLHVPTLSISLMVGMKKEPVAPWQAPWLCLLTAWPAMAAGSV